MLSSPLAGLLVLDLSRVLAGPYCTMILGDLGADVIKVEAPQGDDTRRWGPPFVAGESAYYLAVNRNKRSLVADLKTAADAELIRTIANQADILVENFRPGTLERFGLSLASLRAQNPRLITLTISGMGASGPESELPGYDFIVQATAGLMSITGPANGEASKVGVAVVDLTSGMLASNAILAALYARERTGLGQHIDISLLESQVAWLANVGSAYLITGEEPMRYGNAHPTIVPYQSFEASDGAFALAVGNDRQWQSLCAVLEQPAWADDPRFSTNPQRVQHRSELVALLKQQFSQKPSAEWVKLIQAAGIPVGAVRTIGQVLNDPQVLAREMVVNIEHPTIGDLKLLGIPFKFSATPASIRLAPPLLGQHSRAIRQQFATNAKSESQ
ncbi:CaiB/BaiF CoA transferase family protein [Herpetosiphon geysericola]|uniref:Formyl-CoA transferase n=1 Tax=Herpetosiphon geysericola TaxID=70996 RepID=A0A0P6XZF0_9CHLR|nr:CoA transferase [Herpetosiphon geysericola]KPL81889.1 formyl-CoA transferase [Herpetosiphon geysericola]